MALYTSGLYDRQKSTQKCCEFNKMVAEFSKTQLTWYTTFLLIEIDKYNLSFCATVFVCTSDDAF